MEFWGKAAESYGITHFVLLTKDNMQIGEKTEVSSTLSHVPITYSDSTLLIVELYKEDKKIYRAYIDGGQYGGELELEAIGEEIKKDEDANIEDEIGSWEIQEVQKGLVSSISIHLKDSKLATHYELFGQDSNQIGERVAINEKYIICL